MDASFVYFVIIVQLVFLVSLTFWFYWPATLYLTSRARELDSTPGKLFTSAVVAQLGLFLFLVCAGMVPFVNLIGLFGGLAGWIFLGVQRYRRRVEARRFLTERPLPKMQCSMRDIYTAIFFFAVLMAVCTAGSQAAPDQETQWLIAVLAAYLLLATGLGFYAALDICRRAPEPYTAYGRLLALVGVLLVFSLSGVIGGLIAWCSWQKALHTVGLEAWRKEKAVPTAGETAAVRTEQG